MFYLSYLYVREYNDSSLWVMTTGVIWITWTLISNVTERLLILILHSLLSKHWDYTHVIETAKIKTHLHQNAREELVKKTNKLMYVLRNPKWCKDYQTTGHTTSLLCDNSVIFLHMPFQHSTKVLPSKHTQPILTHWGRVTHICVSKLSILGSDNGLSPGWCQAII